MRGISLLVMSNEPAIVSRSLSKCHRVEASELFQPFQPVRARLIRNFRKEFKYAIIDNLLGLSLKELAGATY